MYRMVLIDHTPSVNTYDFKVYADGIDDHVAYVFVTHRNDQTDITLELLPASGIPNTPDERVEFLLVNAEIICRAISNAQKD